MGVVCSVTNSLKGKSKEYLNNVIMGINSCQLFLVLLKY